MNLDRDGLFFRIPRFISKLWLNRFTLSFLYLRGQGIEIGALHNPLTVLPFAKVRYVDRLSVEELRRQYPELRDKRLVDVDYVADGEQLQSIGDASQDFVIANHFVEHCQNPLRALENMLRVLSPGGVLYLALPDKRLTFDRERPVTPLSHLIKDYEDGPQGSRKVHFEEWVRFVNCVDGQEQVSEQAKQLMALDYSIHYHVWTQHEMLELLTYLRQRHAFDIEVMVRSKNEVIFILRKGQA